MEETTESPRGREDDDKPELLIKLQERKRRHEQRGMPARIGVVVLGVVMILGGIVLSGPGVPGPGFLVILLGLSFLALEFDRAERLLEKVIIWGDRGGDWVEARPAWQKVTASLIALALLAAFIVWAILDDVPLVPLL